MRQVKYVVDLSNEEQGELEAVIHKGKSSARKQTRARILLKSSEGVSAQEIMKALDVSEVMVRRARRCFVEEGLEAALHDKPRPGHAPKLSDKQCAHLIALACSDAPDGHEHWALRLLAGKVVELGFVQSISHETVRRVLKKTSLSHGKASSGAFRK
jgi:transposase